MTEKDIMEKDVVELAIETAFKSGYKKGYTDASIKAITMLDGFEKKIDNLDKTITSVRKNINAIINGENK